MPASVAQPKGQESKKGEDGGWGYASFKDVLQKVHGDFTFGDKST